MDTKNYQFHSHKECEYFPCHKVEDETTFNCLFCYCPLYALGDKCGGDFKYTQRGIKDCSDCIKPHAPGGYDHVMAHMKDVLNMAKKEE